MTKQKGCQNLLAEEDLNEFNGETNWTLFNQQLCLSGEEKCLCLFDNVHLPPAL